MNHLEKFYRAPDGKIVFNASAGIGAESSISCSHLHGYTDNGFPCQAPVQLTEYNIWDAFSGMAHTNLVPK
jgi:hypothetical protein